MINLWTKQQVIMMYIHDGISKRGISKITGLHRRTVSKYIDEYEVKRQQLLNSGGDDRVVQIDIIDDIVSPPKYDSSGRCRRKVTEEMVAVIKGELDENNHKRQNGMAKQQKKKIDIHAVLVEKGYDISYSTVKELINELTESGREAFIRQEYAPGDICEFDWGEVKLIIDGKLTKLYMAVFTAANSNYRWAMLFNEQKTGCFLEAHVEFFEHVRGVYRTMVYDNMRVAVRKFVGLHEKEPTEALLKLSLYYGFNFRFCNIRAGNEKGHVERSVEVVRRKAFAFKDKFTTIDEANAYLLTVLCKLNHGQQVDKQQTIHDSFKAEQPCLLALQPRYETARCNHYRVDKYSSIMIDTCHYSVPDHLVGKLVFAKVYSFKVLVFHNDRLVAEHAKMHAYHQWSFKLEHYANTFRRKPGALASSTALRQTDPYLHSLYQQYYIGKERDFIDLVIYSREIGLQQIQECVKTLEAISPLDISTEKIKLLGQRTPVLVCQETNSEIGQKATEHLAAYSALLANGNDQFRQVAIL